MPLAAGATFAGYTIVRLLGAGGMGEVYLAQHPRLPRQDALKVLSASISADRSYRERFNREADIAAGLWHPHIVEIHDRGEHDGQLWISMDYVDGTDAEQLLLRDHQRGLPIHQVCDIVSAVAEALDHAHQRHLLHRDIKPANILLTESDTEGQRILLADFGIARRTDEASGLTGTNMTVGTIAYAAPEQLLGQELDGRADQYALAATAFHLLTGQPPFPDPNPAVVISQHLSAAPPTLGAARPDLVPLDPVLAKAMAKDPKDRFARGVDFARALRHHLDGDADPGATRAWPVAASPTEARSWWRAGILVPAVLAVLLIVAIVVAATEFRRADDEQPTAGAHSTTTRTTAPATTAAAPAPSPSPATVTDTSTEIETVTETTQTTPAAPAGVAIGANCSPVGATSTTADGSTAYCSTLQSDGTSIWSLTQGEIPSPTITATTDPTETPIPGVEEPPVRVCMQQTRLSRWECRESIRRANGLP